jgi:hypothetical protein
MLKKNRWAEGFRGCNILRNIESAGYRLEVVFLGLENQVEKGGVDGSNQYQ